MIRLGVPQLRQPPMAETQRRVLCHCLRVGVVFLLRPLRSTTTKGVSAQVRARRVEQSSALLSVVSASVDTDSRGPGAAARLAQAAIRPLVHLGLIISNAWSRRPRLGPLAHARSLPR